MASAKVFVISRGDMIRKGELWKQELWVLVLGLHWGSNASQVTCSAARDRVRLVEEEGWSLGACFHSDGLWVCTGTIQRHTEKGM